MPTILAIRAIAPALALRRDVRPDLRHAGVSAGVFQVLPLKRGGNSALIVMRDGTAAASVGVWGTFAHSGQLRMATSRHLVQESIAEEYTAILAGKVEHLPVGDPFRDQVALGPIIDAHQRDRVHGLVTASVEAGATVCTGGT